jgi:biopolymer transport protein ExbB
MVHSPAQEGLFGPYFQVITLNTKASGAGVSGDVENFPVLVRLDSAHGGDILSQAAPGGTDIRVTNLAGTSPLAFEVESWNRRGKRGAIWVLVPLVKGNDSAAAFRIYWGRSGAASSSDPSAVFDTANGFQAVWHMNGATGNEPDATINGFTATAFNEPADTVGVCGGARKFNDDNQRFLVNGSAAGRLRFTTTSDFTISAWARYVPTHFLGGTTHNILYKEYKLKLSGNASKTWKMAMSAEGSSNEFGAPADQNDGPGSWHLITGTFKGTPLGGNVTESIYYDGVKVNSYIFPATTGNAGVGEEVGIGAASTTVPSGFWSGTLDEIRIANKTRSADWIKLEYATQRPGNAAVRVGDSPYETGLKPAIAANPPVFLARAVGREVVFHLEDSHAPQAFVSVTDIQGHRVWAARADLRSVSEVRWTRDEASAGIYFAHVRFAGSAGQTARISWQKISLAP